MARKFTNFDVNDTDKTTIDSSKLNYLDMRKTFRETKELKDIKDIRDIKEKELKVLTTPLILLHPSDSCHGCEDHSSHRKCCIETLKICENNLVRKGGNVFNKSSLVHKWTCPKCTFENEKSVICEICEYLCIRNNINTNYERLPKEALVGKQVIYFFGGFWCNHSRKSFEFLRQWYLSTNRPLKVEIIYVPSDKDRIQFENFFDYMPWPTVEFADPNDKKSANFKINAFFNIESVPQITALDAQGKVYNIDVIKKSNEPIIGGSYPWTDMDFVRDLLLDPTIVDPEITTSLRELKTKGGSVFGNISSIDNISNISTNSDSDDSDDNNHDVNIVAGADAGNIKNRLRRVHDIKKLSRATAASAIPILTGIYITSRSFPNQEYFANKVVEWYCNSSGGDDRDDRVHHRKPAVMIIVSLDQKAIAYEYTAKLFPTDRSWSMLPFEDDRISGLNFIKRANRQHTLCIMENGNVLHKNALAKLILNPLSFPWRGICQDLSEQNFSSLFIDCKDDSKDYTLLHVFDTRSKVGGETNNLSLEMEAVAKKLNFANVKFITANKTEMIHLLNHFSYANKIPSLESGFYLIHPNSRTMLSATYPIKYEKDIQNFLLEARNILTSASINTSTSTLGAGSKFIHTRLHYL